MADVSLPEGARGLIVFAHGSGSSRKSPRNRRVADFLQQGRLGTVLLDLLTPSEGDDDELTASFRFDIPLLVERLTAVTDWLRESSGFGVVDIGYFGASTGAAAALGAAAARPGEVRAVVSRGGRPDLAGAALERVMTPTLFVVGARDPEVLDLNRMAIHKLPRQTEYRLEIITGASHLFEEPGTLDQVAALAREWFTSHLRG